MKKLLRIAGGPLLVLCVLLGSFWLLHSELEQYQLEDFLDGLGRIPPWRVWSALGLTVLNYLILIGYDILGVTYLGHPLQWTKVALGSFLGYAVGNNFGTVLGGSTVRYRLYSSWGLSALDIVKLVLILGVTFWIGLFFLAGVLFLAEPLRIPPDLRLPIRDTRLLGIGLSLIAGGYLVLCGLRRRPIKLGSWEFTPPPLGLSVLQYAVATLDLMVSAGVLYVLLPSGIDASYQQFLGVYLLAIVASLISQVPGGLGVLELVMVVFLEPSEPQVLIGSLLAFRAIYYFIPLAVGLMALGVHELTLHGRFAQQAILSLRNVMSAIGPRILAVSVFGAGVLLLLSSAVPPIATRMTLVQRILPLPIVEISHFLSTLVGVCLLPLARGLQRRIAVAYYVTAALLACSIPLAVLKGLAYEEALALSLLLAVFLPSGASFYRQSVLVPERFAIPWVVSFLLVLVSAVWIMLFAYKRIDYEHSLWWQFAYDAAASRSYRSVVGASLLGIGVMAFRWRKPTDVPAGKPSTEVGHDVARIVDASPRSLSRLALLGDKRFLLHRSREAFIMFAEQGKSCVALGGPVGPFAMQADLAWDFVEFCEHQGKAPVFYQLTDENLALYVDLGLSPLKIGEEARVLLSSFTLEGGMRKQLRRINRNVANEGCAMRIVHPPDVERLMPHLHEINRTWLARRQTTEKSFSLGYFEPNYIARSPVAVVEREGTPIAFANLWLGADRCEMSADLLRYHADAPERVMDFLYIQLMIWARDRGYQWLNLGLVPAEKTEAESHGARWDHLASLAFRHTEHFFDSQGLRQYMSQFDPCWMPAFLATPGGLSLPSILTDVAHLISRH